MNSIKTLSVIIIMLLTISCSEQKDFNSTEWKNWIETEATPNTRWLMYKDLLRKYELKGISKDSLLNLLGEPSKQYSNKYHYYLGYTGRGINIGTMIITFENDIVVDIEVTDG